MDLLTDLIRFLAALALLLYLLPGVLAWCAAYLCRCGRERVRQNTGLSLTDAQIEQVLAGRHCSLEETVRSLIREQGRLYTERLLSAVLEAGFDYHALPVVMMGGGASVVSRHIRPSDGLCRTVTLLDDRVNAQGYERAVAALWGDDAQG